MAGTVAEVDTAEAATETTEQAGTQAGDVSSQNSVGEMERALAALENSRPTEDVATEQQTVTEDAAEAQAEEAEQPATEDAADDADDSREPEEKPAHASGWQKRVDKLTARNAAKDDEIERLKQEKAELEQKLATLPDADVLVRTGIPAGYASKDELAVIESHQTAAAAYAWMKQNRDVFVQEMQRRDPRINDDRAAELYRDRREELMAESLRLEGRAEQIRAGVATKLREDLELARKAKSAGATAKPVSTAATAAAKKPLAKPKIPAGVLPAGSGGGAGGALRPAGAKFVSQQQFNQRRSAVGEFEAATEALAAMRR